MRLFILTLAILPLLCFGQSKPTPRAEYKFSKQHYLDKLKEMDTLSVDTSVVYVSMMKRIQHHNNKLDTTYHVYRFFSNGVFYSKTLNTDDSLRYEMDHPCHRGDWGMYTLEKETIILESEIRQNGIFQRVYSYGILDENELYLDYQKIGKTKIKMGGEDTYVTYLKTPIKLHNWRICWQHEMMNF